MPTRKSSGRHTHAQPSEKQLLVRGYYRAKGAVAFLKGICADAQSDDKKNCALPQECLLAMLGAASLIEDTLPEFSKYINVSNK